MFSGRISSTLCPDTRRQGTVLFGKVNFKEPINRIGIFLNAAPRAGRLTTSNTVGMVKQWLEFSLDDPREASGKRDVTYNKPMFIFDSYKSFDAGDNWRIELNSNFYTKSHFRNVKLFQNFWNLSAVVEKAWLEKKALCLRVWASRPHNA